MIFHFTKSSRTRKSFQQIILNGIKVIVACIVLNHFSFEIMPIDTFLLDFRYLLKSI